MSLKLSYLVYYFDSRRLRIKQPLKNRAKIAEDSNICVIGSVEGVKIAPIIVEPNTTYRHEESIFSLVTIPVNPNTT